MDALIHAVENEDFIEFYDDENEYEDDFYIWFSIVGLIFIGLIVSVVLIMNMDSLLILVSVIILMRLVGTPIVHLTSESANIIFHFLMSFG